MPLEARALHAMLAQDSFDALLLLDQVGEAALRYDDVAGAVLAFRRCLEVARRDIFRGDLDVGPGMPENANLIKSQFLRLAGVAGLPIADKTGFHQRLFAYWLHYKLVILFYSAAFYDSKHNSANTLYSEIIVNRRPKPALLPRYIQAFQFFYKLFLISNPLIFFERCAFYDTSKLIGIGNYEALFKAKSVKRNYLLSQRLSHEVADNNRHIYKVYHLKKRLYFLIGCRRSICQNAFRIRMVVYNDVIDSSLLCDFLHQVRAAKYPDSNVLH